MKNTLLIVLGVLVVNFTFSQNREKRKITIDSQEYREAKLAGKLDSYNIVQPSQPVVVDYSADPTKTRGSKGGPIPPKATGCLSYTPPTGYTPTGLISDDGSTGIINLQFSFILYGQPYTSLYINANGNLTFTGPMGTFTPTAFPSSPNPIVAPFWGDVDIGGGGSISYLSMPTYMIVNYFDCGYFPSQGDKRNNFSVLITDGMDPIINGGNVAFMYGDMQWTTGGASGGVNGFGGTPATAGTNKGDNVIHFLVARFDHEGTDFDGALGQPDGVSWLDYQTLYFDLSNPTNTPPTQSPVGFDYCDTFKVCSVGDTADLPVIFFSPEATQSTSVTATSTTLTNLQVVSNTPGNTAYTVLRIIGDASLVGFHTINVLATDNGSPVGTSLFTINVLIDSTGTSNFNPIMSPISGCDSVELGVLNGPYDSYLWDNLLLDSINTLYTTTPNYGVTVEKNGCYKRITENVFVAPGFSFNLTGNDVLCPGNPTSLFQITDSANYSAVSWGLPNPANDTVWSNELPIGTYTVSVSDQFGYCTHDTTFTVTNITPIVLQNDTAMCDDQILFTYNTGGSGSGTWSYETPSPGAPVFGSNTYLNTIVTFPTTGVYNIIYTDANCPYADTMEVNYSDIPEINFNNPDYFICPNSTENIQLIDSAMLSSASWGLSDPGLDSLFSANLGAGTHTLTIANLAGCINDTTFSIEEQDKIVLNQLNTLCGDSAVLDFNFGVPGMWSSLSGPGVVTFYPADTINTSVEFTLPGVYTLVYSEPVCNDADTLVIDVEFYPYVESENKVGCIGVPEVFTTNDIWNNIDSYSWSNGETGATATIVEGGYYNVTATNSCGTHTFPFYFDARPCTIDMPNVFSPNGDFVNNIYGPLTDQNDSFETFNCKIYNRWGNLMYEFNDMTKGWDGRAKSGAVAADGVYFYNVIAKDISGKELTQQGFFHLFGN